MSVTASRALTRGAPVTPMFRTGSLLALAGGLGLLTLVLYGTFLADVRPPGAGAGIPWWGLAALFFATEAFSFRVHVRSEALSVSPSEFALLLALFLLPPGELLPALVAGSGFALLFVRRQQPALLALNVTVLAFGSALAAVLFHAYLSLGDAFGPAGWVGAASAATVNALVGVAAAGAVLWLVTMRASLVQELVLLAATASCAALASASLALMAIQLARFDPYSLWLTIVPIVGTAVAFDAYTTKRRRHGHLEFLSRSMRAMQGPEFRSSVRELLEGARTMLTAEVAELVVFPHSPEREAYRSVIGPDGELSMEPTRLGAAGLRALDAIAAEGAACLVPRARQSHALDEFLEQRGLEDAMVATLSGPDRVLGLVLVGNRLGDTTFGQDDAPLFETFASHAEALLENDRVKSQLRHQAFHDSLTGLANRVLFAERVREALGRSTEPTRSPVVLFVDLDDFKTINDSLGHSAGDQLLISAAERVRASLRPGDMVARLGGDEFAVLLHHADRHDAEHVAARLVDALKAPFVLEGREMRVHASVGLAQADRGNGAEDLLRNADVAMYSAKTNGKGRYAWYDPDMHVRARRRQELAATLEGSVERDEIEAHFQPIVALDTGRIVGLEALARWRHPRRGLVHPESFIPLAEETGFMPPIGRTVLRLACEQLHSWRARHRFHDRLFMSVNLSQSELRHANLASDVEQILAETGLPPGLLALEITESSAMQDPAGTIETLGRLRELGVRLALDDFGTGYSSLSHLRDFPIDMLKIAKPFVDRIDREDADGTFVDAIFQLATALGLEVVAEGIERQEQADMLRALGCSLGQGYYYAEPAEAIKIGSRLAFGPVVLRPEAESRVA